MTLGRLNTHITHLVSELAQFIVGETELCLLHSLIVTNIDSEHAHYALPHCTMPYKPWKLWLWAGFLWMLCLCTIALIIFWPVYTESWSLTLDVMVHDFECVLYNKYSFILKNIFCRTTSSHSTAWNLTLFIALSLHNQASASDFELLALVVWTRLCFVWCQLCCILWEASGGENIFIMPLV